MKLSILTPMYGGACMAGYCVGMVDLACLLTRAGIDFDVLTLTNESLIQRARNVLVHGALADARTSHILFVDADVGFDAQDVLRLLELQAERAEADVVCAAYSRKAVEWERVREAALQGQRDLAASASSTFVQGLDGPLDVGQLRHEALMEIRRAGTGFMLIRRNVFDTLQTQALVGHYRNNSGMLGLAFAQAGERITAYFDCVVDPQDGTLISEDYYFCDMWRRAGGHLYVAPWIRLSHCGTFNYV
jgi:hypothetical protein